MAILTRAELTLYDEIADAKRAGASWRDLRERFRVGHETIRSALRIGGLIGSKGGRLTQEERWAADPTRCNRCGILLKRAGGAIATHCDQDGIRSNRLDVAATAEHCAQCVYELALEVHAGVNIGGG